jgi:chromosome segregation ATPase
MNALFVALSIMVLALLTLLLWFVPHLLQQQAARVAGETSQLRDMLLDLLNEQEAVTVRQTQLGSSLTRLQQQLEQLARGDQLALPGPAAAEMRSIEARLAELQAQIQTWKAQGGPDPRQIARDNESWANLLSLLATIQDRVGALTRERANVAASVQAVALMEELEQEMQNLRSISEDIAALQWRLRRSLDDRETNLAVLRARPSNGAN